MMNSSTSSSSPTNTVSTVLQPDHTRTIVPGDVTRSIGKAQVVLAILAILVEVRETPLLNADKIYLLVVHTFAGYASDRPVPH